MFLRQFASFISVAVVTAFPRQDHGYAVSLVQHIATKVSSLSGNVNVGSSATIDETGYQEVVEAGKLAQSQDMMSEFARRLCKSDGLRITNETEFSEFLKYFDGSCATQSFDALVMGLHDAIHKPNGCGGGWVKEDDADSDNADQMYSGEARDNDGDFSLLTVRAVSGQKAQMHAKMSWIFRMIQDMRAKRRDGATKTANAGLNSVAPKQENHAKSKDVQDQPRRGGGGHKQENHARPKDVHDQPRHDADEMKGASMDEHGTLNVPEDENQDQSELDIDGVEGMSLDEHGYRAIARGRNSSLMVAFIHKLLKSEGLRATNEKKVQGMAPWYTSECGPQTFAALRNELYHSVWRHNETEGNQSQFCGGWVEFL